MSLEGRNPLGIGPKEAEANSLDVEWRSIMERIRTELEQNGATEPDGDVTFPNFEFLSSASASASASADERRFLLDSHRAGSSLEAGFVGFRRFFFLI